jgi:hypothetical protein
LGRSSDAPGHFISLQQGEVVPFAPLAAQPEFGCFIEPQFIIPMLMPLIVESLMP